MISKKAAGVWIKLPCIDNFGSCDYPDLCQILSSVGDCPDPITSSGLGCQCPFKSVSIPHHLLVLNANGMDFHASWLARFDGSSNLMARGINLKYYLVVSTCYLHCLWKHKKPGAKSRQIKPNCGVIWVFLKCWLRYHSFLSWTR